MLRRGIASSPCTTDSTHPSQALARSSDTQHGVANEYTIGAADHNPNLTPGSAPRGSSGIISTPVSPPAAVLSLPLLPS